MKYNVLESVNEKEFTILVDGKEILVKRDYHLRQNRNGDTKPKDFAMSKTKYQDLISRVFKDLTNGLNYTITWKNNGKSNAISLIKRGNEINIFACINNSNKNIDELYKAGTRRINL